MSKTDKEVLLDIEDAWEEVKDDPKLELKPKAINWMIEKLKELL